MYVFACMFVSVCVCVCLVNLNSFWSLESSSKLWPFKHIAVTMTPVASYIVFGRRIEVAVCTSCQL